MQERANELCRDILFEMIPLKVSFEGAESERVYTISVPAGSAAMQGCNSETGRWKEFVYHSAAQTLSFCSCASLLPLICYFCHCIHFNNPSHTIFFSEKYRPCLHHYIRESKYLTGMALRFNCLHQFGCLGPGQTSCYQMRHVIENHQ